MRTKTKGVRAAPATMLVAYVSLYCLVVALVHTVGALPLFGDFWWIGNIATCLVVSLIGFYRHGPVLRGTDLKLYFWLVGFSSIGAIAIISFSLYIENVIPLTIYGCLLGTAAVVARNRWYRKRTLSDA